MKFIYNDAGRKKAGHKGYAKDCVVRAIAICNELPYNTAYNLVNGYCLKSKSNKISSPNNGVYKNVYNKILKDLGYKWVAVSRIGTGCRMHLKKSELPKHKRMILRLSKHLVAIVNSEIHDTHNPSRNGTRCVYGYWYKK